MGILNPTIAVVKQTKESKACFSYAKELFT
jgi:hypothetical protein